MTTPEAAEILIRQTRDRLQSLGIAADELTDEQVWREMVLKGMVEKINAVDMPYWRSWWESMGCDQFPIHDRKAVLSSIEWAWYGQRFPLRALRDADPAAWPDWLPPIPGDEPEHVDCRCAEPESGPSAQARTIMDYRFEATGGEP